MGKLAVEARVGAFVLAALVVLVGLVLVLGDFRLAQGVRVHADFAYTGNLQVGAPVKISGIRVGRVGALSLLNAEAYPPPADVFPALGQATRPVVRASLEIDREVASLVGSKSLVHVGMQGVIGEAYIEVTPGAGEAVVDGTAIRGVDAPRLHVMALQMSAILASMGALIGDGEDLELGEVGHAMGSLLSTINALVGERKAELGQALSDMAAAAADLRKVLAELRRAVGDGTALATMLADAGATAHGIRQDLPALIEDAQQSLASVQDLTHKANEAVDAEVLKKVISDAQKAAAELEQVSRDARLVLRNIRRGEGTVGGLVQDAQIYDDLKEMLRDLKQNPWKLLWRD